MNKSAKGGKVIFLKKFSNNSDVQTILSRIHDEIGKLPMESKEREVLNRAWIEALMGS